MFLSFVVPVPFRHRGRSAARYQGGRQQESSYNVRVGYEAGPGAPEGPAREGPRRFQAARVARQALVEGQARSGRKRQRLSRRRGA